MKTSFLKILSDERYDGSHYMLEVDFFRLNLNLSLHHPSAGCRLTLVGSGQDSTHC